MYVLTTCWNWGIIIVQNGKFVTNWRRCCPIIEIIVTYPMTVAYLAITSINQTLLWRDVAWNAVDFDNIWTSLNQYDFPAACARIQPPCYNSLERFPMVPLFDATMVHATNFHPPKRHNPRRKVVRLRLQALLRQISQFPKENEILLLAFEVWRAQHRHNAEIDLQRGRGAKGIVKCQCLICLSQEFVQPKQLELKIPTFWALATQ